MYACVQKSLCKNEEVNRQAFLLIFPYVCAKTILMLNALVWLSRIKGDGKNKGK